MHITDLVRSEVIHNDRDLQIAIDEHKVEVHKISLEEIQHLVKSFSNFDEGEASCFKLAKEKNWRVATDDGAAKALVRRELGNLYVVTTFDILLEAVDLGFLTKDQARQLIEDMASKADFQYSNQEFGGFIERLSIK
ncbi:MAG: hypothetical protein FJ215_12380 [Ignavibacteria bacterium]|nr:hypothetical protein [Ignavibacteria bacterium]